MWTFNSIDVSFIATLFIISTATVAVSIMFVVVPTRSQYFYSMLSSSTTHRNIWPSFIFLIFIGFEIYAKSSQGFMVASDAFTIFPNLQTLSLWMYGLSRLSWWRIITLIIQCDWCSLMSRFVKNQISCILLNNAIVWSETVRLFYWNSRAMWFMSIHCIKRVLVPTRF